MGEGFLNPKIQFFSYIYVIISSKKIIGKKYWDQNSLNKGSIIFIQGGPTVVHLANLRTVFRSFLRKYWFPEKIVLK